MFSSPFVLFNLTMTISMINNHSLNSSLFSSSSSPSMIYSSLIAISLSLIALITALGNIVVLLAFYIETKLRTINDYFILNMAIADFLVGIFCIPFYIPFSINQIWPFGRIFCKIWVTVDDVATMASVINIVAISINRYWSIAYPISYRKYVGQHLVYLVMTSVWLISFLNFAPGIWLLNLFSEKKSESVLRQDCSGDYNDSFVYMLIAQFNYFIWPFVVLCVLNMLIVFNIWRRSRRIHRLMSVVEKKKDQKIFLRSSSNREKREKICCSEEEGEGEGEGEEDHSIFVEGKREMVDECEQMIDENLVDQYSLIQIKSPNKTIEREDQLNTRNVPKEKHFSSSSFSFSTQIPRKTFSSFISTKKCSSERRVKVSSIDRRANRSETTKIADRRENSFGCSLIGSKDEKIGKRQLIGEYRQRHWRIERDRRAARSLFILVLVFLIFLFPYVICATMSTAGFTISPLIFEISFWLLWLNSTFNPFLYPFIQMKYRRAYFKLFHSLTKSFH